MTAFIRLSVAAERHGLTVAALRREARLGRLAISRVAGKDWTTEDAVMEMFERCRVPASRPASISAPAAPEPEAST